MDYKVNLKVYEGPMELLIDLIKKNEVDIYDIPIHIITSQFLEYITEANKINLELTSDFLVMASTLLEIKSKVLLPKINLEDDEIEENDPRDELVQKILEYEKYKEISEKLRESEIYELKAFYKLQDDFSSIDDLDFLKNCNVNSLFKTMKKILERSKSSTEISEIYSESFPIQKANDIIVETLKKKNTFLFSELIGEYSFNEEIISYFLAILELIRMGEILVRQTGYFTDIKISRRENIG
ncbi:condensin subunit ScpA [Anaerosphaera aminiphila DSM 21120]|uniref:Segregation and condensation protein A n=1 Tax=Anaerosphaera aminiphila DSM 21120 TaxID=1120995 RepID=A0A1M5P8H0_9FIRM|nr:segregation/condensation protein A [Anaerosphaera aminiphila]SHG98068.1 condensin subunit ScpA [Anaerosphaera aminiphila DSM 21120]